MNAMIDNSPYSERNQEICRLYLEGKTLEECGELFSISRQRVKQILRKNGVWRPQAPYTGTGRDEMLGVLVTEADKEAVRQEALRRGISMSALTAEAVHTMLMQLREPVEP